MSESNSKRRRRHRGFDEDAEQPGDRNDQQEEEKKSSGNLLWWVVVPFIIASITLLWCSAFFPTWVWFGFKCTSTNSASFPSPPSLTAELGVKDFVFPDVFKNTGTCGANSNYLCPVQNLTMYCQHDKMRVVFHLVFASGVMFSIVLVNMFFLYTFCQQSMLRLRRALFLLTVFAFFASFGTGIGALATFEQNCGDRWCDPLKQHFEKDASSGVSCTASTSPENPTLGCGRGRAFYLCVVAVAIQCVLLCLFMFRIGDACDAAKWKDPPLVYPLSPVVDGNRTMSSGGRDRQSASPIMLDSVSSPYYYEWDSPSMGGNSTNISGSPTNPLLRHQFHTTTTTTTTATPQQPYRNQQQYHPSPPLRPVASPPRQNSQGNSKNDDHDGGSLQKEQSMNTFIRETVAARRERVAAAEEKHTEPPFNAGIDPDL